MQYKELVSVYFKFPLHMVFEIINFFIDVHCFIWVGYNIDQESKIVSREHLKIYNIIFLSFAKERFHNFFFFFHIVCIC